MPPSIDRPTPGVLVADGLLGADGLDALVASVARVVLDDQRIGLAAIDGLPERRRRGQTDDPAIPAALWAALGPIIEPIDGWRPVGCNPRTRVYRYRLGERFAPHVDEPWRPAEDERTFLTVLAYLPTDEPCLGGETVIDGAVVTAEPGRVVVFDHGLRHEGRPVERGEKLVVRSDVVFSRRG